jgi:hypothetical protein
MTTPRYRSILRTMLGAVLQSNLSSSDLNYLSNELRRGQLPDELAFMIDQMGSHFRDEPASRNQNSYVSAAESRIKSKRLPKDSLINIISSISNGDSFSINKNLTVREILERFFDSTSPNKADQLIEILDASGTSDPYLRGISETRR